MEVSRQILPVKSEFNSHTFVSIKNIPDYRFICFTEVRMFSYTKYFYFIDYLTIVDNYRTTH